MTSLLSISRSRRARTTTALVGAVAAVLALSSCSAGTSAAGTSSSPTPATLQLGWIANSENGGPYLAEKNGYYAKNGVDITIKPGGPTTTVEPLVASGKALVGLSSVDTIARAVNEGADLVIVGATLQINPMSVMSLASKPVNTLKELEGKRFCVQTSGVAITDGILKANGVDKSKVEYVNADFDPSPLVSGQCDAFEAFSNNQPVTLKLQGVDTKVFPMSDYGYHLWGDVLFTTKEALKDPTKRAAVEGIVKSVAEGWQDAIADPDASAQYVVDGPGKNQKLDLAQQKLQAAAFVPLIKTSGTTEDGLLTMSKAGIAQNIATMRSEKISGDLDALFDTSLLSEIYKDGPTLD
ncbi:ABC transporter substrate-binding protein [Amnibacterium kyonggiense]|uniref:Thiamine pyrimidine synthase n=1 Tax=Amnibacterium kyonggiense TaxID=595671 RepID=A0A4R7FLD6_9MICO|nr:ABC transporter substrate-binding protein [Amnibacterium kyonggiense]TDS77221.1 ABC-type nitrate/sulfonate/bicarbonate transport system substrate-binding protein [Amnibacterium kyonggiense]